MENWLTKIEISSHYENLIFIDDLTYSQFSFIFWLKKFRISTGLI